MVVCSEEVKPIYHQVLQALILYDRNTLISRQEFHKDKKRTPVAVPRPVTSKLINVRPNSLSKYICNAHVTVQILVVVCGCAWFMVYGCQCLVCFVF